MKALLFSIILLLVLSTSSPVYAQENCVQVYGQGVVCGAKTFDEVHVPVQAGISDFLLNPTVIGTVLFVSSGVLYWKALKNENKANSL